MRKQLRCHKSTSMLQSGFLRPPGGQHICCRPRAGTSTFVCSIASNHSSFVPPFNQGICSNCILSKEPGTCSHRANAM
eukprot:2069256-Pyramimonas_sp.AAC.1